MSQIIGLTSDTTTKKKQSRSAFFGFRQEYEKQCLPLCSTEQVIMNVLRMLYHRGYNESILKFVRKHGVNQQTLQQMQGDTTEFPSVSTTTCSPQNNPFKYIYPRELQNDIIIPTRVHTKKNWQSDGYFVKKFVKKTSIIQNEILKRSHLHPKALVNQTRPWYYCAKSEFTSIRDNIRQDYFSKLSINQSSCDAYQYTLFYTFCTENKSFIKDDLRSFTDDIKKQLKKCNKRPLLEVTIIIASQCAATAPTLKDMARLDPLDITLEGGIHPRIQYFTFSELSICVLDHAMQPEIRRVTQLECEIQIKDHYKSNSEFINGMPQIQVSDPVARCLDLRIGDVVERKTGLLWTLQCPSTQYCVCVATRK